MTLKQAAQSALDVQSACNLSGVARSFGEVMIALRGLPECKGTEWANRHPIARLYAEQIAYLTTGGSLDALTYTQAHDACTRLAGT